VLQVATLLAVPRGRAQAVNPAGNLPNL